MVENTVEKLNQLIDMEHLPLNKEDVSWGAIRLSEVIEKNKRIDASMYNIEAKHIREKVLKSKYGVISLEPSKGELIDEAFYPGRFKRIYVDKEGIPFYLPSQMNDIYPKSDKFISPMTKVNIEDLKVKQGSILLTRSGTIGNVTMVSETLHDKVFSDDVIRISFKDEVDCGYVYTYLKTKTGQAILQTNSYGSVITHIEPEHLKEVIIPNAPYILKDKINTLVRNSYNKRDRSNQLIDEATSMLIENLGLPPIEKLESESSSFSNEVSTFSCKLSDLAYRLESSYHSPIVSKIEEYMRKNADITSLKSETISKEIILPGRFKRIYVKEGYGKIFIGGKQLFELDPVNKKYLSLEKHGDRIEKELTLEENMILVTCSGTIGKVMLVPKHWNGWTANQHVLRIVSRTKELAGYIYIWLNTDYGKELIKRHIYGSVVDEINAEHLGNVKIPIPQNAELLKQINNKVLEANKYRYEAYILEQEALGIMNTEIIEN